MKTYISLLRGINVSGKNKILMKDLKSLYEKIGLINVVTYIQSGNVIFKSDLTPKTLKMAIENGIFNEFNLIISVLIETPNNLNEAIDNCSFLTDNQLNKSNIYFSFLNEVPINISDLENSNYGDASFNHYKNIIYLYYPNGAGKTKLTNNFIEKKLHKTSTTRNLKTVLKLTELSS